MSSHKRTVLTLGVSLEYGYNCRSSNECPLQNKCLPPKIIYRAKFENDINDKKNLFWGFWNTFQEALQKWKKKNLVISNTEIAPNCPNTSGS